jgi:hypothetical protein
MSRFPRASSPVFDDVVWGANHDAFDSDLGRSLVRAWSTGAADDQIEQMIHQLVRPLRVREAFGNLVPFRRPRLRNGDILLGRDHAGHDVRIPLQSLVAGLLIAANTGGGKSVLLSWLLLQIAASGCRFWVSDMYKSQIRQLLPLFKRGGTDLLVVKARDWKYNLLQAHGTDPSKHLPVVVDLLMRRLSLPPRARTILQQTCHSLYGRFGIWAGRTDAYPCLFDLYERVKSTPRLNAPAREAILDRLGALLTSLTPGCGAYRKGWSPVELSSYSIDFEMRGSSELVKQLLLEPVLYSLLHDQLERGAVNADIDLFVAFEDSQRFFESSGRANAEFTPIDELASVTRGTGRGLGVIVQTMIGLSPRIIPNLATKVMGRLGSHEDYQRLGADLGLTRQQREWARLHLRPGRFIVQVADGAWRHPFVLDVPLVKAPMVVSDAAVEESLRPLHSLSVVPAPEFANWEPSHLIQLSGSPSVDPGDGRLGDLTGAKHESPGIPHHSPDRLPLSKEELDLLHAVIDRPFRSTRERDQDLQLSAWKGNRIRSDLASKGLITTVPVNPGGRGARFHLLQLTERGRKVAASYGMRPTNGLGRGGILHQWWANTISTWLGERRHHPIVEDESSGARVDIAVETESLGRLAIEVETSAGNELHNIKKDLDAGFSTVVSLVKEPSQLSRLRPLLPLEFPTGQVHLGLLPDHSRILASLLEGSSSRTVPNEDQEPIEDPPAGIHERSEVPTSPPPVNSTLPTADLEAMLDAVVAGGNTIIRQNGGTKLRRRTPQKQERLLRLLTIHRDLTFGLVANEFSDEWERVQSRASGEAAKREFFRNITDLASRINDALVAAYQRDGRSSGPVPLEKGGFAVIDINHQSYTVTLRVTSTFAEIESRDLLNESPTLDSQVRREDSP